MKKTNKGFTLVELVVVIAIIGVLAAILVPSMLNYVKKSRLKTANSNAKTAYNAVAEFVADAETRGVAVTWPTGTVDCVNGASAAGTMEKVIEDVLKTNGNEAGLVKTGTATINGDSAAFFAHWAKTAADDMVGQYPEAQTWDNWKAAGNKMIDHTKFGTWTQQ